MMSCVAATTEMWKTRPKPTVAVRYDPSALPKSQHLLQPFPPRMSREVLDFLGDEEIEGARNLML